MKITKRNGDQQEFTLDKIVNAITKANSEVTFDHRLSVDKISSIATLIEKICQTNSDTRTVEKIQDEVETALMKSGAYEVAKKYITYRYLHSLARDDYKDLMSKVEDKLKAKHVVNQNANVDEYSFGGRMGEATDIIMREFALNYLLSEKSKNNHLNNEIYIHDLNAYSLGNHNCLSVPFDDLLEKGFNTRQTDVRPAQSVNTAMQLIAVIFQLQSLQQFGGVSATHLDWTMVPYVRKSFFKHFKDGIVFREKAAIELNEYNDNLSIVDERYKKYQAAYSYADIMTKREIHQAVEGMYHNLNTLQSRSGNQLPFTSINYGTCTEPEGQLIIEELLDVNIHGIGKLHKTPIFPCSIFQMMNGVNRHPGEPNYYLFRKALESTSKRLYPNYANVDWSNNKGWDRNDKRTMFSTMGCRTSNGFDINGLGQQKDGRGNICPVTIIMPTLAMEAHQDIEEFMKLLDVKIHEAKDMLLERFDYICSQSPKAAKFMYENGLMAGYVPEEGIRSALKHGTIVIGQLGLAETLHLLIGCDHTEERGMELAKRIEQLFNTRCGEFKQEYKLNFGVYYTPAENLAYTAMQKFKEKYGSIPNVSDKEFFTNSMHVPVWKKVDIFEKIDIESQLTGYSNAGCITYVELDSSSKNNIDALETIVNYAMDKDIPYFAINVPNDQCMNCGCIDDIPETCPQCGSTDIMRLRRVTGYLTSNYTTTFNKGKIQETEMRVRHHGEAVIK